MYDSVSVPVEEEALNNSHRGSLKDSLSQHKIKAAVAILFVVVVALVGLSNTKTAAATSQSTSAYLEAAADAIAAGESALKEYAIQGVMHPAYITHGAFWNTVTNYGIYGKSAMTTEEQWDLQYLDDQYGQYYKLVHSHDKDHWLTTQGEMASFNPTVTQAASGRLDKQGYIRWSLAQNADGSSTVTGTTVPAGPGVVYYLVSLKRDLCVGVMYAIAPGDDDPTHPNGKRLQNSVKSFAKDPATGTFPDECQLQFVDASQAPPGPSSPPRPRARSFWRW